LLDTQEVAGSTPARPTPSKPPNSFGGLDFERRFDRKCSVDRVGGVLAERVGHVLIAAQHAQILVTEHVEDDGGRNALAGSRVAAE
jgi:hypothetical protein